jgi:signal transduction histidine kinase
MRIARVSPVVFGSLTALSVFIVAIVLSSRASYFWRLGFGTNSMWAFFERLLDSSMFSPHGICLLWEPELIWLHVASDAVIAAAYFSIPVALSIFVSKRRDVDFGWIFWAFAIFIMACGFTHVLSIVTLWVPVYGIEGIIKALTAVASIVTAAVLWPLLPKVLALPSPSQLRQAEAALAQEGMHRREAEEMLRHSQKMEAIGQLTGGVAHDFNNLLTIISGNLEIAERSLQSWGDATRERLTRVIANAANGAQRAATLTQRLLAFARRQPLDPRLTNVNQLLAGMSDFFRRTLGENIDLEFVGGAGPWQVEVDPSQMEATILNLVVNAKDAMASEGKLTIETSNAFVDESYAQQNADIPVGQYVQIAVSDTGSGMPRDVQEKAFDPFFTTKQPGQGTGLGLSQVYGFVKQSAVTSKSTARWARVRRSRSICRARMSSTPPSGRATCRWSAALEVKLFWWSRMKPTSDPIWWKRCKI